MAQSSIGKKMKGLSVFIGVLAVIAFVVLGIVLAINSDDLIVGVLVSIFGSLLSFLAAWLLYAFGEVADKVCLIEQRLGADKAVAAPKKGDERGKSMPKKAGPVAQPAKAEAEEEIEETEAMTTAIRCPGCREELFFSEDVSNAECPYCGYQIKIN